MRKTLDVPITEEGRDQGKVFRITEMPAWQGEEWAYKVLLALTRAGADVPDPSAGLAGLKMAGLQALTQLSFAELKPILDEMMGCVSVPDKNNAAFTRAMTVDDTEEIATRIRLRAEVFNLHTDFLKAGLLSSLNSAQDQTGSQPTQTSQGSSGPSSRPARRRR